MPADPRPAAGRPIPQPPPDLGEPDPVLAAALSRYRAQPGPPTAAGVQQALHGTRLLVPVVAILVQDQPGPAGRPRREKVSEMAAASLAYPDGRSAALAFTGVGALARWRADARPVAVPAAQAARAALAEGRDALVLDVAGPAPYAVRGSDLAALAEGTRPAAELAEAIAAALGRHPVVAGHRLLRRDGGAPVVVLRPAAGVSEQECGRAAAFALDTAVDVVVALPDGIDIAVDPG